MGDLKIKRCFFFMLAVVIFAGVLSLLTSPALALDNAKCEAWAKEIRGRVEDIRDDPDFVLGTIRGNGNCPNLCENEQDGNDISVSPFLRQPAGILAATIIDILTSPGDRIYGTNLQGMSAFFCVVPEIDANNFTKAIVAVGHSSPTDCATAFTEICRVSLSSPVPIE
jgi:hypothetical protein